MTTGPTLGGDGLIQVEEPGVESVAGRDASDEGAQAQPAAAAPDPENAAGTPWGRAWRRLRAPCPELPDDAELGDGLVTFSDLVRAHRAWEQELYKHEHRLRNQGPDTAIDEAFRTQWRKFEGRYGQIVDAYWSVRDASAVALTIKRKRLRWRPEPELRPRFHRATDWATRDEPEIAEALDECETLAVRVEEIVRGASELIALRRINAVASHVLGFVDRERGRHPASAENRSERGEIQKPDRKAFVARQREELKRIERFYDRAGNGQARILFFWGMAQGLLTLVVLTGLAVTLTWFVDGLDGGGTHWGELQLFVISVMAGALGALLSVLSRMASLTGKFDLDHEVGRKNVRWIGIYRPFVGGIFGVATFLMLASGILQTQTPGEAGAGPGKDFAYYGILAFFSGFFERFTKLGPGGVPTPVEEGKGAKGEGK